LAKSFRRSNTSREDTARYILLPITYRQIVSRFLLKVTNPCSAEAEATADVPDEEYKEPSIRQKIFKTFFLYKKSGQRVCDDSVHTYSMPMPTELKSRRWELYK
jgi:hypothetical protein